MRMSLITAPPYTARTPGGQAFFCDILPFFSVAIISQVGYNGHLINGGCYVARNDNDSHLLTRAGCHRLGHLGATSQRAKMVIFHKKISGLLPRFMGQFISRLSDGRSTSTTGGTMPYTEKQVAALQNAAKQYGTLNGELAARLADELGQSKRSVIAKIKSLDLPYAVAAKPVKGTRAISKADYVAAIAKALDADASTLDGLEKATALSLSGLLAAIR